VVLELLELEPLMDLGLRLGEGSGAAISLHLIRLACRLPREMATFDEAGVSGKGTASATAESRLSSPS
jgi:nicotinate-nucleotide--dimethylbenzimidazole phosphoribosyltransferase